MSKKTTTGKGREMYAENLPVGEPFALLKNDGNEDVWVLAQARRELPSVVLISTRKGNMELPLRERVTIDNVSRAKDALWCKHHDCWKIVSPSGEAYCKACKKENLKRWAAAKRAEKQGGEFVPRESREQRDERIKAAAMREKMERLAEVQAAGIRRTEAFFADAVKRDGNDRSRVVYSRYLTDERMDEIAAEVLATV